MTINLPQGIQRDDTEHGVTYYTAEDLRQAVEDDRAQRGVPDGWVPVPVEPTDDMLCAGYGYWLNIKESQKQRDTARREWQAMLTAAPTAPQAAAQAESHDDIIRHDGALKAAWMTGVALQFFVVNGYDSEWADYTGEGYPTTQGGRLAWRIKSGSPSQVAQPTAQAAPMPLAEWINTHGEDALRAAVQTIPPGEPQVSQATKDVLQKVRDIKVTLMHQRRFGVETLAAWRTAAVSAEADLEGVISELIDMDRAAASNGKGEQQS